MDNEEIDELALLAKRFYENDDLREELMLLIDALISPVEKAIRMDLRDYFAAAALPVYIRESEDRFPVKQIVKACYEIADAMMKAREGDQDE